MKRGTAGILKKGGLKVTDAKVYRNVDNDCRMPLGGRGIVIGHVDEVNGSGAQEISDFLPTRHELLQVAKYWACEELETLWFEFLTGQTGSTESRVKAFAQQRIARIDAALGGNDVGTVVDVVYTDFGSRQDQRLWEIFCRGDRMEWEAVQEETWRKLNEDERGQKPEP